ncbi:MAG TPA: imidazoleglycerol-phosphate dehydratase HisB [Planctomycetaceae bacterium]|nr:imidazoleglycerol-phosphate dehydratase HisB [Planctomycetaceae bacterium]
MARSAKIERKTKETEITVALELDGSGRASITTGVGFLDHMLELFAHHGRFDLEVEAIGDLQVDDHHTVEDIGICLGQAFREALGDKAGIGRYGYNTMPMDETLVRTVVDLSGRPFFVYRVQIPSAKIGSFDSELVEDFWQAFATHAACNLHMELFYGRNSHHIAEALFKSAARSLWWAVRIDPDRPGIPSTKGTL